MNNGLYVTKLILNFKPKMWADITTGLKLLEKLSFSF